MRVNSRARVRGDRAGNPLDGLVNMFDLGIVLAVAFLIAALEAHGLTKAVLKQTPTKNKQIVIQQNQQVVPLHPGQTKVTVKNRAPVGEVYQLPDGSLVYVKSGAKTAHK
jgi:hypothetical protein